MSDIGSNVGFKFRIILRQGLQSSLSFHFQSSLLPSIKIAYSNHVSIMGNSLMSRVVKEISKNAK